MDRREHLDDVEESLRLAIEGAQARIWTALPGVVVAVDLAKQTVSVQPSIYGEVTGADGVVTRVALPLLVDVPLVWPRAGGFALTLPVTAGDEVLVVFAARCIDAWWQNGGTGVPMEPRMHDLSDGFALLAPTSQPRVLADVQTDGIELRNDDRSLYVRVSNDAIRIRGNIIHEGNLVQTGTQQVSGLISANGGLAAQGGTGTTVSITGNVVHTGGTLVSGGKNVGATHTHSGVQGGPSNTGVPN